MRSSDKQAIEISTIPVTIKVIQVGGKKLTTSVFNQIPESDSFFSILTQEERSNHFIGWVEKDSKYILYSYEGILLKHKIDNNILNSSSDWEYRQKNLGKRYKLKYKEYCNFLYFFLKNNNQIYIAV